MKALWFSAVLIALVSWVASGEDKLIVILIDGFRWDYLNSPGLKLKGFPRLEKYGVRAEYINPVYPTLSYPNMNSFVTGLYPESHGFVDNYLWDKRTNRFFQMIPNINTTDPMWWNDAEPIWITSENKMKHAAMYWWSGCEVEIQGQHPTVCERHRYDPLSDRGKQDFLLRINDVIEMFQPSPILERERLNLAMFYNSWVDWAGHYRGLDSEELKQSILALDEVIDYLLNSLKNAGLENKVNVMVLSDHGMQDVTNSTYITLDKYAPNIKYQINTGPTSALVPMTGKEDKLVTDIQNDHIPGLHVFKAKDIPESFHIKHTHRIPPVVLEADPSFFIKGLQNSSKRIGDTYFQYYGEHGYDPENNQDMKSIFLAAGPEFRSGYKIKSFDIIDLYNVMCKILKIDPLPNNGTWENVESMLRTDADGPLSPARDSAASSAVSIHHLFVIAAIFTLSFLSFSSPL